MADPLNPAPGFWRGKKVLLTGHTGFKGAWLALWLQRLGAQVCGYALPADRDQPLFDAAQIAARCANVFADIRDRLALIRAVADFQPEIVLHLAAQSLVRRSYREPIETYETNLIGTINVLECLRTTPSVRAAVIVTSDKCYDNREWLWPYRENEPLGGTDPYSSSKACAEIAVAAWRRSFFADGAAAIATARAGNVIGGGDKAEDRLIPDCIRALLAKEPIPIRNPQSTRPWQHVLEPLCGYLLLCERLHADGPNVAEAWNFGPAADDTRPVGAVADMITTLWGDGAAWRETGAAGVDEAGILALDSAKARNRLGWQPRLDLAQAVAWTVDWYKRYHAGESAGGLMTETIARYEAAAALR